MVKTQVKSLKNALLTAELYLVQGIAVTITPNGSGHYTIEKKYLGV